jgi:RHS repeat-associated protein
VVTTTSGTPLRAYNPGFTSGASFTPETDIVSLPVTRTRLDALGRVVEQRGPNGALTRTVTTAWSTEHWDPNDSVRDSDWFRERRRADATTQQIAEADAAERHAGTPSVEHFDVAGRPFLVVEGGSAEGMPATRTRLGASGEVLAITDPRGIVTESRSYDMSGRVIYVQSAASGETRVFHDVNGDPVHTWGALGQEQRLRRDPAGRPTHREVRSKGGAWRVAERMIWGEQAAGSGGYMRGRLHAHYDGAGLMKISAYDFEGNPLRLERKFRTDLTTRADWTIIAGIERTVDAERAAAGLISSEILPIDLDYDALGRVVSRTAPDGSVVTTEFGLRGLANRVGVTMSGATTWVLDGPTYDAAGRRVSAVLGNGVVEQSTFDVASGLLIGSSTIGPGGDLRALTLGYDAVGNVLSVFDSAQQTRYFRNVEVLPHRSFAYDALYRLVRAEGREAATPAPSLANRNEPMRRGIPHPKDLTAVRRYTENYSYDRSGNLLRVKHVTVDDGSWTASYDIDSRADRITAIRNGDESLISSAFNYDDAGNALTLGGLSGLTWDNDNQLVEVDLGGGGRAFYTYDAGGRRASKVIVLSTGVREERLYLDGYERFRRLGTSDTADRETTSLHVGDSTGRIAIVERRRTTTASGWLTIWRYQHPDQVGSCTLETDGHGDILTFEEYRPFGATSYHAAVPAMLPKRFRFGGQESDEETGLNYHGARYYAPWLCRWISPDPAGMADGTNRYWFARNNPVTLSDRTGLQSASEQHRYERVGVWGTTGGESVHWMIRIPVQGVAREITAADIDLPSDPTPTPPTTSQPAPARPPHHRHSTRPRTATPTAPPAPDVAPAPVASPAPTVPPDAAQLTKDELSRWTGHGSIPPPPTANEPGPGQLTREELKLWTSNAPVPPPPAADGGKPGSGSPGASGHIDAGRVAGSIVNGVGMAGIGIGLAGVALAFPVAAPAIAILGLSLLLISWGESYQARQSEANRQGYSDGERPNDFVIGAVALGDAFGATSFYQASNHRSILTDEPLSDAEASDQMGIAFNTFIALASAELSESFVERRAAAPVQRGNANRAPASFAEFAPDLAEPMEAWAATSSSPGEQSSFRQAMPSSSPQEWTPMSNLQGETANVTGQTASQRNRAIRAAIDQYLAEGVVEGQRTPGVTLTHEPVYNPYIRTGMANRVSIAGEGVGVQLGQNSFSTTEALLRVIIHEELHHRWWRRGTLGLHHPTAAYEGGMVRFDRVVERYLRLRGIVPRDRNPAGTMSGWIRPPWLSPSPPFH